MFVRAWRDRVDMPSNICQQARTSPRHSPCEPVATTTDSPSAGAHAMRFPSGDQTALFPAADHRRAIVRHQHCHVIVPGISAEKIRITGVAFHSDETSRRIDAAMLPGCFLNVFLVTNVRTDREPNRVPSDVQRVPPTAGVEGTLFTFVQEFFSGMSGAAPREQSTARRYAVLDRKRLAFPRPPPPGERSRDSARAEVADRRPRSHPLR